MKQIEAYESSSGAETEIAGFVAKTYQILNVVFMIHLDWRIPQSGFLGTIGQGVCH